MVRVLMINYEYPPLGGGTAIANQYLVKEFRKMPNLTVDVLTSSAAEFKIQRLNPNIRLVRLNIGKNEKNLHHQSYPDLIRFFWQSTVWTLRHQHEYDLIHAFAGLPGSVTAWLSAKLYLVSFRGTDEPGYEQRHKIFWRLFKPLMGYIYSRAKSLDTNSHYLKNLVLRSWPNLNVKVINNGVDSAKFYPAKKPAQDNIILCTSRLGDRKGVEYLVRALTQVSKAELWLAGGGNQEEKIRRLVKKLRLSKRVKFLGKIDHDRLPVIYRQAKIFVLPSLSESQSNSLLEALASGLPVVATNIGGNSELVNSQNGILVPAADSQALAQAINDALNRSWPKIKVDEKFTWANAASQYAAIYLLKQSV